MQEEKKEIETIPEEPTEAEVKKEKKPVDKDTKIKNLISVVILLAGLFVGSLFVDVVQLVKGGGYSQRALSSTDVFSAAGKTWVAYSEPIVKLQVINDDTCGDPCKPDDVLVGLKQALPTLLTEKVDANSPQGKQLISQFGIKTLPAFVFSKEIEQTDLFSKAQPFLNKQGDSYAINSAAAGFPVGKYIAAPDTSNADIKVGSDDASVKVVAFSDFANPTDATNYQTIITPMLKDYNGKIQFVFENYFAPGSSVSTTAALAAECANAQGKFADYASKLFAAQSTWSKLTDPTTTLETYAAQLGMSATDFNKCLSSKQFQPQVDAAAKVGQDFGIQGTPSMFIGTDLQPSTVTYDDVKKALDSKLGQ